MGTADKESKGLKILGKTKPVKILLEGIDQAIILNPTVVEGLSHPLNLGLGFMKENKLTLKCNHKGVIKVEGRKGEFHQTRLVEGSRQPFPFIKFSASS